MLTFYNEHHAQHAGRFAFLRGGLAPCSEQPERAALVLKECERRGLGRIVTPHGVPLVSLERVHSPRYLHFLRSAWSEWTALDSANAARDAFPSVWPLRPACTDIEPEHFDARFGMHAMDNATPLTAGTWLAAKTGADCAVNAAHALRMGERGSFALTRPPGHHAGADFFGGGCFLNGRSDVLFLSLHADPRGAYPWDTGHAGETGTGAGLGYTMNLPLAAGAGSAEWFAALETACVKLAMFRAEALVVSLGTPAFGTPPEARFRLQGGDFLRIGERIAHLGLPTAFILEGGDAAPELGTHIVNVLEGFETATE